MDGQFSGGHFGGMKETFRDLMLRRLDETGMSLAELSRRSNVSYDALNKVKRRPGSSTSAENAVQVARVLQFEWDGHGPSVVNDGDEPEGADLVPLYDVSASAGHGAVVESEERTAHIAFAPDYLRNVIHASSANLQVIKVQGESMEPTLRDGDLVMIDRSKCDLNFDGLFVLRFGDSLQVKRVNRSPAPGHVEVISDNAAYGRRDWPISGLDPLGRVLWIGKRV